MQMLKTYGRHVGEKLSMVDFVSVMMRWNRRIASSNGVAVRFFMPDAHDHGDEHQCAAEQTRSEHRRIEPMTLHTHDNQHDELRQQRRAPTQYGEGPFCSYGQHGQERRHAASQYEGCGRRMWVIHILRRVVSFAVRPACPRFLRNACRVRVRRKAGCSSRHSAERTIRPHRRNSPDRSNTRFPKCHPCLRHF